MRTCLLLFLLIYTCTTFCQNSGATTANNKKNDWGMLHSTMETGKTYTSRLHPVATLFDSVYCTNNVAYKLNKSILQVTAPATEMTFSILFYKYSKNGNPVLVHTHNCVVTKENRIQPRVQ